MPEQPSEVPTPKSSKSTKRSSPQSTKKRRPAPAKYGGVALMQWQTRGILLGLTVLGAILYGLGLSRLGQSGLAAHAVNIQVAAALSWAMFGGLLLFITKSKPSILAWVDACLMTMVVGMGILILAPIGELVSGGEVSFTAHIILLVLANLAMAGVFLARSSRLKLEFAKAAALWFGVMNGVFGLILVVMELMG